MKQWTKDGHEYKKFESRSLDALELSWKLHFPDGWDVVKEITQHTFRLGFYFTINRALERKVCCSADCNRTANEDNLERWPEELKGFCEMCRFKEGNLRSARIIENLGKEKA